MDKTKTYYYKDINQDFVFSKNQNYKLPESYQWIHKSTGYKIISALVFRLARIFGWFYCTFFQHARVVNRKVLKQCKDTGYFLYGNHTQEIGDVFQPVLVCGWRRYFAVAGSANLGIPFIGKLLPMIGALPIPDNIYDLKKLLDAIETRVKQKYCVVVYPEAHVWPYCTMIRDFSASSFRFPVDSAAPSFSMTTTYQKRRFGSKPKITVYVDGPFYPDAGLPARKQREDLKRQIFEKMTERSKNSTYSYIRYIKE